MTKCPLTREDCTVDCAWFKKERRGGKCTLVSIADSLEALNKCVNKHDNYGATYYSFNVETGD